jgi:hypothetical protein
VWVSLSKSAGVGDACRCEKRLELGVAAGAGAAGLHMTDQMRTEVEVLSQIAARQHRGAAGMEQGRHGALLSVRLDGGW